MKCNVDDLPQTVVLSSNRTSPWKITYCEITGEVYSPTFHAYPISLSEIPTELPFNQHEIPLNHQVNPSNPPLNPTKSTTKSPWNHHEITIKPPLNHHELPQQIHGFGVVISGAAVVWLRHDDAGALLGGQGGGWTPSSSPWNHGKIVCFPCEKPWDTLW